MLETFIKRTRLTVPADRVYAWHAEPAALQRLTPPGDRLEIIEVTGGIEEVGARIVIRTGAGLLRRKWISRYTACEPGRMFRDELISGPLRRMIHTHSFIPDGPGACWLEDHIEYELPLGFLGRLFAGAYARRKLQKLFAYRHRVTAAALQGTS
jgi:hypothetical protein